MENKGCQHKVFDRKNAASNTAIAATYGSELAADFGMIPCGKDVTWAERCMLHAPERRGNKERRVGLRALAVWQAQMNDLVAKIIATLELDIHAPSNRWRILDRYRKLRERKNTWL